MMRWMAGLAIGAMLAGCATNPSPRDLPAYALWAPWSPPLAGHAARQSTWDQTGANRDAIQIAPGETATLFDASGPGIIRHIWLTTAVGEPMGRTAIVRMCWDGAEEPAVEAPLGDFFGVGHGLNADVHSFPITVNSDGRSRNCWWPMPFAEGARITVTNEGPEPHAAFYCYVDYLALDEPPPTRERFHAQYRQSHPSDSPENHVFLETLGEGHYMGVVHSIESLAPNWWGEGDDLIEVDDHEPLRGTGTEDYFGDAWGTREYEQLWHGVPICEGFDAAGLRTTQYRFHVLDPIPFQERIRVSIEHGTENDRIDNHSSVAFWYQVPPASPFPPLPPAIARLTGGDLQAHLREQAFALAMADVPDAEAIEALLPHADDVHAILVRGMAAYANGKTGEPDDALPALEAALAEIDAVIATIPEDQRYVEADRDLPTDPDAPVPADAIEVQRMLQRARHDLVRHAALVRGHLAPGDEIIVEVRGPDAVLTPPPTFEATEDWTYSYAKSDDVRLVGRAAHFTYGGADPSWARFTPDFSQAGEYEVLVIFSYGSNAADTRWEVRHAEGTDTIALEQRGRPGTENRNAEIWHSLGTFRFNAGQSAESGSVTLHASPGTALANDQFEYRAYADAVRFLYQGD